MFSSVDNLIDYFFFQSRDILLNNFVFYYKLVSKFFKFRNYGPCTKQFCHFNTVMGQLLIKTCDLYY